MKVLEGNAYRHKKTQRVYSVLAIGLNEADLVPVVIYQHNGGDDVPEVGGGLQTWVRPVAEFCDGRFEPIT